MRRKLFIFFIFCFSSFFFSFGQATPSDSHSISLYYSPSCPYSQNVLGYLKKNKKTVDLKNVYTTPNAKEELMQIGGRLQVPCLIIDLQAIYSDTAIIEWLSKHLEWLEPAP